MIYKNYEAATLERVLPVAIGLLLLRATMRSGIEKLTLTLARSPSHVVDTHPYLAAHLIGLEDFCRQLPELRKKRELVQQRRRALGRRAVRAVRRPACAFTRPAGSTRMSPAR